MSDSHALYLGKKESQRIQRITLIFYDFNCFICVSSYLSLSMFVYKYQSLENLYFLLLTFAYILNILEVKGSEIMEKEKPKQRIYDLMNMRSS